MGAKQFMKELVSKPTRDIYLRQGTLLEKEEK